MYLFSTSTYKTEPGTWRALDRCFFFVCVFLMIEKPNRQAPGSQKYKALPSSLDHTVQRIHLRVVCLQTGEMDVVCKVPSQFPQGKKWLLTQDTSSARACLPEHLDRRCQGNISQSCFLSLGVKLSLVTTIKGLKEQICRHLWS